MALTFNEYMAAHPGVARHMVRAPGERPDTLDSGFFEAAELLGWPQYEGGYLHWMLIDVRLYTFKGWEGYEATPFRVHVSDYDDWDIEKMFATREEAEEAIALLATGPVDLAGLRSLGFATT